MLDTSKCQKPEKRMSFRGIRASKFRHVFGSPAKKEKCFENIRITRNAHDGNYCAVNPKFLAVVVEVGGGGSFLVLPIERTGRVDHNACKVSGHTGPVLDLKWNPFNDNVIASASEDCSVNLWYIPDGGLSTDLREPLTQLQGHRRRVGMIEWHPTAENILVSAGYEHIIIIWDISRGTQVSRIDCHSDTIYSMSFNRTGSLLATTCKDRKIRIIEPRTGKVAQQGNSHQGTKASKVVYLGDTGRLLTTGFSKFSDREYAVWSEADLTAPLRIESIDSSSGVLIPFYDPDTQMVYIAGKGDGNIRYYEVVCESPWVCYLSQFISGHPQRGFGVMPKRGVDVSACEIFRFYKLHATRDLVEPVAMIVPRKSDTFQQDIYPETAAPIPALTAGEWMQGKNCSPVCLSMKTGAHTKTYKPVVYKPGEHAIVVSDRSYDRKFMFLAEETKPDYRPVNERKETKPSPKMDHRPFGAERYQVSDSRPKNNNNNNMSTTSQESVTEKDVKTSLNLGTKFQEVHKKWTEGSLRSPGDLELDLEQIYRQAATSGSQSVRSLTNRFDYKDNREHEQEQDLLKRTVIDQQRQIHNMRLQMESKDRRIADLEDKIRILSRHSTPVSTPINSPLTAFHHSVGESKA